MDKVPKLGSLIKEPQGKDAVHIAVAPVIAGETLQPGQRIGFSGKPFTVRANINVIGIVDPFLRAPVKSGQEFYMFLLPNTITSLRHEWTHPEFEKEEATSQYAPSFFKLAGHPAEEKWLSDFAINLGSDYDELMAAAKNYLDHGEYFSKGGQFEGSYIPEEFWQKYSIVTGEGVNENGSFLSCSC